MTQTRILAISGSLRKASYNTAVLEALSTLAPHEIQLIRYQGLATLPSFNPDLAPEDTPEVSELRREVARSDGLVIASPEYAHGISGVLKNALDWLVSGEEFVNKPIALINTSPRASHAQASLREVIRTMSGKLIEQASVSVPLLGSDYDTAAICQNIALAESLCTALGYFSAAIQVDECPA